MSKPARPLTVLDLFSGIGGFSLGLERAGMRTVAFCEIDEHCRAVLAKHWPAIPCYHDIRELDPTDVGYVDIITGGFPCQPFSSASRGRKKGTNDDRWLWPEMRQIVAGIRPSWVVCENAHDFDGLGLGTMLSDLEVLDYQVLPFGVPACAVRLDHIRPRCWVVGHTDRKGQSNGAQHAEVARMPGLGPVARGPRGKNGLPSRMDRRRLIGNAVIPAIAEQIGKAFVAAESA